MATDSLTGAFRALGVALAIGLLIGLERGWAQRDAAAGERVAGFRTFGLLGLLGGVVGLIAARTTPTVLGLACLAVAAILTGAHFAASRDTSGYGITSEVASFLTFTLGVAAAIGYAAPAAAAAVIVATLLGFKTELHGWIERLDRQELTAALQLALVTVVILPLLPDEGFGPYDALNPYRLWAFVALISAIAFLGHFAVRILGEPRGTLLTGLFGGLASSTALTLDFARAARDVGGRSRLLAVSIVLAAGMTFPKMLVEVGLVNEDLLVAIAPALVGMAVISLLGALSCWLMMPTGREHDRTVRTGRPFKLRVAMQFAVVLGGISVLSEIMRVRFGDVGVYALAGLSGLANVDAITLSLASSAQGSLEPTIAQRAIVLAGISNTLAKAGLVMAIVRGRMAFAIAAVALATAATGNLILIWT